jgi:tricorn protease
VLQAQTGLGAKERFLPPKEGYFTLMDWSPDGQQLVLQDNHLHLYKLSLAAGPRAASCEDRHRPAPLRRRGLYGVLLAGQPLAGLHDLGRELLRPRLLHELASGRTMR